MIKKLRLKFIFISILSVLIVLFVLIGAINVTNYISTNLYADRIIDNIVKGNGTLTNDGFHGTSGATSVETFYETRYFTVKLNHDNTPTTTLEHITAINEEKAIFMANNLKNDSGYYDVYRYRVTNFDKYRLVTFVDCHERLSINRDVLMYSVMVSLIGFVAFFALIFVLSRDVFKPVAESYNKQKMFISNASHELKTPLTIISANNELLEMKYGESNQSDAINKQIVRMKEMIKNISTLAKMDEQIEKESFTKFNISDIIYDNLDSFKNVFIEKNIKISSSIVDDVEIKGDENLFRTLINIIFDNAQKYANSYFDVKLVKGHNVLLTFTNDNINIKKGSLEVVFDRFYRTDEARASNIDGSGIGLSMAKEIVMLHKGKIEANGISNKVFELKIIL